jgi:hypothetical protein
MPSTDRRNFNGAVSVLMPAFGIDTEETGTMKFYNVLDIAWEKRYNQYEAALLLAYSFAAGLYGDDIRRADDFVANKLNPIQTDWVKKGIVRSELVSLWPATLSNRASATHGVTTDPIPGGIPLSPSLPDVTKRQAVRVYKVGNYMALVVASPKSLAEEQGIGIGLVEYVYAMAITSLNPPRRPVLMVTAERSGETLSAMVASTGQQQSTDPSLCVFDSTGAHENLGASSDLRTSKSFRLEH